jgi:hypothetical protein
MRPTDSPLRVRNILPSWPRMLPKAMWTRLACWPRLRVASKSWRKWSSWGAPTTYQISSACQTIDAEVDGGEVGGGVEEAAVGFADDAGFVCECVDVAEEDADGAVADFCDALGEEVVRRAGRVGRCNALSPR